MNDKAPPARWYALWRPRAARNDDWADQGTAFGLDMSMMEDDEPAPPALAQPQQRGPGWVRRLTARRRGAA